MASSLGPPDGPDTPDAGIMTRLNTSKKGKPRSAKPAKSIASTQSLSAFVKSICDVMRRSNCASALQYVPELTWILFLRILDAQDGRDRERAEALGTDFSPALASPYRWQDWAAPPPKTEAALEDHPRTPEGKPFGWKRQELFALGDGRLIAFINKALLLKMGEKNSDGGQFFTPREVIRAMVHTVAPSLGQTVYDPCCGTGGFLAIAYEHIARKLGEQAASTDLDRLKHDTFFGREKENLVFPIALANLVLHGIDQPNLWHGNALTRQATYGALYEQAPRQFDVILTNPPFGGKEGTDAQKNFSFRTGATQVLFVQDILAELAPGGTCGIVLDEGFLFRTNESAFVETKRKLVDECDLWAIVSLPGGVFSTAGPGSRPTWCSSPRAVRPSASGTTT
jgi:type I restriction-modification system DNA methylase subunit